MGDPPYPPKKADFGCTTAKMEYNRADPEYNRPDPDNITALIQNITALIRNITALIRNITALILLSVSAKSASVDGGPRSTTVAIMA